MSDATAAAKTHLSDEKPVEALTGVTQVWHAFVALFWGYTEASEKADRTSYGGLI